MTSIISTSASSFVRSLHGGDAAGSGVFTTYTQELYRYQLLYDNVIVQLNQYINYFASGNYSQLVSKYTKGRQNTLILKTNRENFYTTTVDELIGFEYDPTKFNSVRQSTYNVIDGLYQTVTVVQQNAVLKQDISGLLVYKRILEDPVKLIEYIEREKLNTLAFTATETFQTEIKLKPWFQQYLLIHGPPGDGVFKSDYLAQIVLDLIQGGIITEEQFINS